MLLRLYLVAITNGNEYSKRYALASFANIFNEDMLLIKYSEAKEETISLKDLPRSVHVIIKKHAAGGKIIEIEKGTAEGTVRYEA